MDKLKLIYKLLPIPLVIITVFAIYSAFTCWQDKKTAQKESQTLSDKISQLEQTIDKNNQIIAQREKEKTQSVVSIKQLHEQLKDVLKNNRCANEDMPSNISDWMRNGKN
ncbi:hypothetical protein [Gilliamella sp. B2838]|uniref:hypothetical protein n=1 Tax=Gilliamella sp. B2838 TaxID=2818020 RepID=UPI00226A0E89|nr:hypothetical protein [Gilliamella sp. B2838]MCX8727073.1 hypothetical protein [Gilliamella sp. B2838]